MLDSNINVDLYASQLGALQGIDPQQPLDPKLIEEVDKLKDLGEQFETIFFSMMLKQMRTSFSEEGFFAGDQSDVYGGMFDMYMSEALAKTGALGIGDAIQRYARNALGDPAIANATEKIEKPETENVEDTRTEGT